MWSLKTGGLNTGEIQCIFWWSKEQSLTMQVVFQHRWSCNKDSCNWTRKTWTCHVNCVPSNTKSKHVISKLVTARSTVHSYVPNIRLNSIVPQNWQVPLWHHSCMPVILIPSMASTLSNLAPSATGHTVQTLLLRQEPLPNIVRRFIIKIQDTIVVL